jgi:predicted kinase
VIDLVLGNGLPGSGKTTVATGLAAVLEASLISKDAIKEAVAEIVSTVPGPANDWDRRLGWTHGLSPIHQLGGDGRSSS